MIRLNEQQHNVVYSDDPKILCLAGAGTGKTACMILRIRRLVKDGVDPNSILVLTFTNAAAFEMKQRYIQDATTKSVVPQFRTFHSFCYWLLKNDTKVLSSMGYKDVPRIAEDSEVREIESRAKMQMGVHLNKRQLSGAIALSPKDQRKLEMIRYSERRIMKQRGVITFDSLCYDVCDLFTRDSECIQKYKSRFKYIFVDEFQDTDPKQWKFVQAFADSNIFVVGDALQSIYSFRGADSSIIKSLAESKEWKTFKLYQNYRSTTSICEFANQNTEYAKDSYRIRISGHKNGDPVDVRCMSNWESDVFASEVFSKLPGTKAILCRTNQEVSDILDYLKHNSVECRGTSAINTLHVLKSVQDDNYCVDYLASLLSTGKYSEYLKCVSIRKLPRLSFTEFQQLYASEFSISEHLVCIRRIRSILEDDKVDIVSKYSQISRLLKLTLTDADKIMDLKSNEELLNFMIQDHESQGGESDIDLESTYVGTIHSAKGLEYDNVLLVGVGGKSFPLTSEENCNLYYVGITRAKIRLFIHKG